LEEVFMRIVNEDIEEARRDRKYANHLMGASAAERDDYVFRVQQRDHQRFPVDDAIINAALTKGSYAADSFSFCALISQVKVMIGKRFHQFTRSKGQFFMGVLVPIGIIMLACVILNEMPTQLTGAEFPAIPLTYSSPLKTIVAGHNVNYTESNFTTAFENSIPVSSPYYVGNNYASMYTYVNQVSQKLKGVNSSEAISYVSTNNFTVMYNASYPMNYGAAVSNLLNSAIFTATEGALEFIEYCTPLPQPLLNTQSNSAYYGALVFSIFSGSLGSALSIVLGGERVSGVKHQQLASGASVLAYWVSNFVWDMTVSLFMVLLFSISLAVTNVSSWGGIGFGVTFVAGLFYSLAATVRFYCFSYFIGDVKMAQTFYFYGSILIMYVILQIWGGIVFGSNLGNVYAQTSIFATGFCTILDPVFGYAMIVLFQNNLLGGRSQIGNASALYFALGGIAILMQCVQFAFCTIVVAVLESGGITNCFAGIVLMFASSGFSRLGQVDTSDGDGFGRDNSAVELEPLSARPALRVPGQPDPDVLAENRKVQLIYDSRRLNTKSNAIFVHELRKIYFARGIVPTKVAVKGVSLSIAHGEIFGLLGANGAGKTTLLKMVSGLEAPTDGVALIDG